MSALRRADGLRSSDLGINSAVGFEGGKKKKKLTLALGVFACGGCCL